MRTGCLEFALPLIDVRRPSNLYEISAACADEINEAMTGVRDYFGTLMTAQVRAFPLRSVWR
jgi:hypothetical protein